MTPDQCRAARALLGISQDDLALKSRVSKRSIASYEAGESQPYERTLAALVYALEDAGVEFIAENGGGVGLRMRNRKNG